jgi:hypothetical protein
MSVNAREGRRRRRLPAAVTVLMLATTGVAVATLVNHASSASALTRVEAPNTALTADPTTLATTLRETAAGHLQRWVPDRGTVVAQGEDFHALPAAQIGQAKDAYVEYGSPTSHSWRVFVGPNSDIPAVDHACEASAGTATSSLVSCNARRTSDGGVLVTTETVLKDASAVGEGKYQAVSEISSLTSADLARARVDRTVTLYRSTGTVTSATETVIGASGADFTDRLTTPETALTAVAVDPALTWR